jgi:hypothetical protein
VFPSRYEINLEIQCRPVRLSQGDCHDPLITGQSIKICDGCSDAGTDSSPSASVFLSQYHTTPYSSSSSCFSYHTDKLVKPWNLQKLNGYSDIGEHWIEKYVHVVFKQD